MSNLVKVDRNAWQNIHDIIPKDKLSFARFVDSQLAHVAFTAVLQLAGTQAIHQLLFKMLKNYK